MLSSRWTVYFGDSGEWSNGLVLATVARMASEIGGVRTGVHFLADAVHPIALMAELRKSGVEQTESLEQLRD
ncbi:MAG TPA: hypothetical protein VKY85_23540 [Candidatus Angelobacter sp.]|nr:hypothetical protein [Candidatus Angelobacter sp.]